MNANNNEHYQKHYSNNLLCLVHIQATSNNTIITFSDIKGNTLGWCSPGILGFKGSRRSTSYAAQATAEKIGESIKTKGIHYIQILLKGFGEGRESSIRGLRTISGLNIISISDVTPIPHNGCRLKKRRRI